jgi:phosphoenolpyruvate-protein kinase (PTS system EI component)
VTPAHFTGTPVSGGMAAGRLYLADGTAHAGASAEQVAAAFAAVATDRAALASRLRAAGREEEADIVGVAALIAGDALLVDPAVAAVRAGVDAVTAVGQAAEAQARVLASLDSPELAERAGDVRQVAQAVLEQLAGDQASRPDGDFILIRREVAAADLIELADQGLTGAVSVAGGASSHAAIIARGLGLPMLAGTDEAVLACDPGRPALLDTGKAQLIIDPQVGDLAALAGQAPAGSGAGQVAAAGQDTRTADGQQVTVLCNVASAAEVRRGLAEGAAGVGLLRTEIPFTGALAWPTAEQHEQQLAPLLLLLAGLPATVRLLDFSGDKIPPFLPAGRPGLAELLEHPAALADQLRAVLIAGRDTELAVLIPMVSSPAEIAVVRNAMSQAAAELRVSAPRLGIMVELAATAAAAQIFAPEVDFFSIGTNDLTGQVLGLGRLDPAAGPALAADPRVLGLIAHVVDAAAGSGIPVSVCGDSAADPVVLPLLIGLGIRAVSVPAARVGRVRDWLARLDTESCAELAAKAISVASAHEAREPVQRADLY